MRLTRDHVPWAGAVLAATTAAGALYAASRAAAPYGTSGGSAVGLGLGAAGLACMLVAAFLSVRKKLLLWRIGSAQLWMRMHLWLGALAVPLILLHGGFRLGGALTTTLMVLFAVVSASGVFGLVVQHSVPRRMTAAVPSETVYAQIDHVVEGLRVDAYELVAALAGAMPEAAVEQEAARGDPLRQRANEEPPAEAAPLREIYLSIVRPYLWSDSSSSPPDLFSALASLPEEWAAAVQRLADLCEECRQLRLQRRLHHLLHAWLFVHAPVSLALLVLALVHAVTALRY